MVVGRRFGDLGTSSAFPRVPMPCSAGGAARSHGMCAAASPALRPSAHAVVARVGVSMGALTGAHTLALCGGLSCLLASCTCFHIPTSHALLQAVTTQLAAQNCRPLCKCSGTDDAMPCHATNAMLRAAAHAERKQARTHTCSHARIHACMHARMPSPTCPPNPRHACLACHAMPRHAVSCAPKRHPPAPCLPPPLREAGRRC